MEEEAYLEHLLWNCLYFFLFQKRVQQSILTSQRLKMLILAGILFLFLQVVCETA